ncbi:MAG: type II toxin-antitoxin system VapC family toxin [Treponema sp.]|nr:type II toxin-antitoxin system VapC family toxin [Treponema sp.]
MSYLLDACALIAWLDEEKGEGYEAVDALFEQAESEKIIIRISVVNLVEVLYHFIRDMGQEIAGQVMQGVADLPIEVLDTVSPAICRETARFKANYSMSLADCFLCATAKNLSAAIVTKDKEIRAAEQAESLAVLWIE